MDNQPDQKPTPQAPEAPQQPYNIVINNANHNTNTNTGSLLQRNWVVALVLSIFLGIFGIDRFYLGNPGLGIIKLLTVGLFGIMWIIDIIMIATKSVRGIEWV